MSNIIAYRSRNPNRVQRTSEAIIPSEFGGSFLAIAYETKYDNATHLALVKGDVRDTIDPVLVRIHSKCFTGDVLGSQRCDCGPQLRAAMSKIDDAGRGVILYLDQEGRGIGLANKLKAYALQDQGYDTISANERLGFAADSRDYGIAAQMLVDIGVSRLILMTNNPSKLAALSMHGLDVVDRCPLEISPNLHSERYLRTKRDRMGHMLTQVSSQETHRP